MKTLSMNSFKLLLVCGVVGLSAGTAAAAAQVKDTKAGQSTNSAPAVVEQEVPKSLYAPPASPKERNPFFPQSVQVVVQPTKSAATPIDTSSIMLNGITPSGPKRTAMINGKTFEAGETGEIKTPTGNKVMIKCEEIRADSVIIVVDGLRRELKMRFGL